MSVKKRFDMPTMRRLEIERYARDLDVANTDDFLSFFVAWQWHNPNSKDAAGALMMAAKRMGGAIAEEQAEQIINEADTVPKCRKADALGRYLRLTDKMRTALGIMHDRQLRYVQAPAGTAQKRTQSSSQGNEAKGSRQKAAGRIFIGRQIQDAAMEARR